jgi:hypothetical protein
MDADYDALERKKLQLLEQLAVSWFTGNWNFAGRELAKG